MKTSLGMLKAELAQPDEEATRPDLMALINSSVKPPTPVTEQDVYIRSMYIVSDQINSYGGRFPSEEHPRLVQLLSDSPVLVGHRKDSLPVGRTFHAEQTSRDGQAWVRTYFYWLRASEGAESLRENIDGGIYKECSIGFTFLTPECSICEQDVRQCHHVPLERYIVGDREHLCFFNYRDIQRVLETSLVYRGATPDTSISKDLSIVKTGTASEDTPTPLQDLSLLNETESLLVVPSYEGIDVSMKIIDGLPVAWRSDGRKVDLRPFGHLTFANSDTHRVRRGRLVGYRGKERCSRAHLERYLQDETGPVSRLVLFLFPNCENDNSPSREKNSYHRVQMIRHRFTTAKELQTTSLLLSTKSGVEIFCELDADGVARHYLYRPAYVPIRPNLPAASLSITSRENHAILEFGCGESRQRLSIRNFDLAKLTDGRRFVAEALDDQGAISSAAGRPLVSTKLSDTKAVNEGWILRCDDARLARLAIRPITIASTQRFLLYRLPTTGN